MPVLNFPDSPTNGQEYEGYVYDSTDNVWNRLPNNPEFVRFSENPPSNPQEGTLWYDTTAAKMYVYYNDGSSSQWVSAVGGVAGQEGTAGQMLIHDGTEWVATNGRSRNLIYNGAMQVHQRGTSATGITGNDYFTADRWRSAINNLGTWTQTVENDGPTGSGLTKSLKVLCTTANASPADNAFFQFLTRLEGQDLQSLKKGTSNAETLTVSFWVKSNVVGTYIFELYDGDNARQVSASYSISSSEVWEKKTISINGDTLGAFDNDSNSSMQVIFHLASGASRSSGTLNTSWNSTVSANRAAGQTNLAASNGNYWQITGVQLETGTIATPFEHKSYATELAECQRYYQYYERFGMRTNSTSASSWLVDYALVFSSEMRSAPSFTYRNSNGGTLGLAEAVNHMGGTVSGAYSLEQYSGTTKQHFGIRYYQSGISYAGIILYNVELDAEL